MSLFLLFSQVHLFNFYNLRNFISIFIITHSSSEFMTAGKKRKRLRILFNSEVWLSVLVVLSTKLRGLLLLKKCKSRLDSISSKAFYQRRKNLNSYYWKKMDLGIIVQFLDEAVCIWPRVNAPGKSMDLTILPLTMHEYLVRTGS